MKDQNPFSFVWKVFSTISGIISIASFTESVIAWKAFIPTVIDAYQSIVYFPFKFFHFNIPNLLIDYLFIGSICGASYVKAISFGEKNGLLSSRGNPKSVMIFYFMLYLFFWPLGLLISLKQIFFKDKDITERKLKLNFIQWMGTLLLGFLIILILNSFL